MTGATTILIVEDDPSTRMLIRSVLTRRGYTPIEAENGRLGLAAFSAHSPDMVLMDVMMPEMNGFEACEAMRKIERGDSTPIIMLTAAESTDDVEKAFESGATDFITKPINWPLLAARIRYSLRASRTTRELQRTRLRQMHAQRIARLGFWVWHSQSGRLEWSADLRELTGFDPAEIDTVDKLLALAHPDDRERLASNFSVCAITHGRFEQELRLVRPDETGTARVLNLVAEHHPEQGEDGLFEGAWQDLTQVRETEHLVRHMALHDQLTGLPNRKLFLLQLESGIEKARSHGAGLAVVLLDINRFSRINDGLGIKVGDLLLGAVTHALRNSLPEDVEIARIGGDEFGLLFHDATAERVRASTELLLAELSQPFLIEDNQLFATMTAGISMFPEHARDAESLLQVAHDAQERARSQGCLLDVANATPKGDAGEVLQLEFALRSAVEQDFNQFHLVYQPQLCLKENCVVGVESLLRWEHPALGLIPPPRFIPIMEEMGMINALGEWIIREACGQQRQWEDCGMGIQVGINLSPRQFQDQRLPSVLQNALDSTGANPHRIKLEITESIAMQDPLSTIEQLSVWRDQGFQIAIDDFGIGYSSLEYLLRFPLDTIKIDRAFVTHIVEQPSDRAIVRAITVMAQSMGLKTIAEGVETQRQRDYLDAIGVNTIQGYLLGKPMKATDFEAFLREREQSQG